MRRHLRHTPLVALASVFLLASCDKKSGTERRSPARRAGKTKRTDAVDGGSHRYNPRTLMPLAVGDSWTYRWTSPAAPGTEEVKHDKPILRNLLEYGYGGKRVYALGLRRTGRAHEERYTVTRVDGEEHFFAVTSSPEVPPEQLRDGRYDNAVEQCWLWSERPGEQGTTKIRLIESITRTWSVHERYLLGGGKAPAGHYPSDDRIDLDLEFSGGAWSSGYRTWHTFRTHETTVTPITDYDSSEVEVSVPAGHFTKCIQTVLKVYEDKAKMPDLERGKYFERSDAPLIWETHTFWAPGVGMVREYQKLGDGTTAYDLELVRFSVGGRDSPRNASPAPGDEKPAPRSQPGKPGQADTAAAPPTSRPKATPAVRLRLSMPPAPLEPWTNAPGPKKSEHHILATFRWFEGTKEAKVASRYHVLREAALERAPAARYLPLKAGRWWTYRRTMLPYVGLTCKYEGDARCLAYAFSGKSGRLASGGVLDARNRMGVVADVIPSGMHFPKRSVYEYTITLGKPIPCEGGRAFPVALSPPKQVRDGRYERCSRLPLWLRRDGKAGAEFWEVLFWRVPQRREELITERPIAFNAGYSRVRTYGTKGGPSRRVIQGHMSELHPGVVKVAAGEFRKTIRMIEYVQPRGGHDRGLQPPEGRPEAEVDNGWITMSWYAPGVGLVKEVQYTKGGRLCYELELLSSGVEQP